MIRASFATLAALGLKRVRVDALPKIAYLMVGQGCRHNCLFCSQARGSQAGKSHLSRVEWIALPEATAVAGCLQAWKTDRISGLCLQVVDSPGAVALARQLAARFCREGMPVSVSCRCSNEQVARSFLQTGCRKVSLALDAAGEDIYRRVKGGSFRRTIDLLSLLARDFPGKVNTHLIAGLGESEEEMVKLFSRLKSMGISWSLFAFTPLPGTPLATAFPPEPGSYRRLQAASFLIGRGLGAGISFRKGRIAGFGLPPSYLKELLSPGEAFQTRGCPGCNRPYYNERPGGFLYNYPRPLTSDEVEAALAYVLP